MMIFQHYHYLDPVEEEVFKASAEVLLVSQEDLVEVAHPADKHPVMDVELVETAGKFCPAVKMIHLSFTFCLLHQLVDPTDRHPIMGHRASRLTISRSLIIKQWMKMFLEFCFSSTNVSSYLGSFEREIMLF